MDIYTRTIIESWVTLILTVALIIIGSIALVFLLRYIRVILKRASFLCRLRKKCRETGVTMKKLSSPYKSVFVNGGSSEILLEKEGKLYTIKFFTCIQPKDSYQFDPQGDFHRISNFRPIYVRFRFPIHGGQANSTTRKYIPPAAVQMNESFLKKSSAANFRAEQIKDAVHLLCINPAACEIFKVEGSSVIRVFDGDELCGYKVYSGGRLLEAKEIFG